MQCKSGKESGWKWGEGGHCYTGKDAKKHAMKQGMAVEGPENFKKMMKDHASADEEFQLMAEVYAETCLVGSNRYIDGVKEHLSSKANDK